MLESALLELCSLYGHSPMVVRTCRCALHVCDYVLHVVHVQLYVTVVLLCTTGAKQCISGVSLVCYRCIAAVQRFTEPSAGTASEEARALQHVLLGAGSEAALRAAAQQSPRWVGGSAGQGRLKTALAALQETTHAPGMLSGPYPP